MDYDTDARENIAQTVAKLMEQGGEVDILPPEKVTRGLTEPLLMAVPSGQKVEDFTRQLREAQQILKPLKRKGTAKLSTIESVIEWANRFKGAGSILYAQNDGAAPTLTCIADYHEAGPETLDQPIGIADEFQHQVARRQLLQVERDGLTAA